MTYVSMDAEGVQEFINALQSWVDDAETEQSELYNLNNSWDPPPVEGIDEMLSVPAPFLPGYALSSSTSMTAGLTGTTASVADATSALQVIIDDLQTRLDEAIAMNESGITFGSEDGTVCYYLPDGVEDTPENVKTYNSGSLGDGAKDAEALQQALGSKDGTAEDGRTVEEILDEMAEHQDVPAYGAAVVEAFGGVDGYLDNLLELQWQYNSIDNDGILHVDQEGLDKAVGVLGRVLASATQSGGLPEGYGSWSEAMYQAVTVKGHRGRMSALNALLAVDGAVYDTTTLVDLADRLEDLPFDGSAASNTPDSLQGWYDEEYGVLYDEGKALRDYSMDPLYGVTMAMGNNPEAAFKYLNPDGQMSDGQWVPGEKTRARWELLTGREWDSEVGLDGFTAAMAGNSAMRGSDDVDTAAAATWTVARSMEFAVDQVPFENYTETMKENLSVVVANTAEEGVQIATGGPLDELGLYQGNDSKDMADAKSLYTTLIYRVIDNENAAATITSAFTNAAMEGYPEVKDRADLAAKYREIGSVYGYLNAIGSERLTDLKEASTAEKKAAKDAMGTMLSVLTTVVGAGVTGPAAKLAWSVGTTVTKPIMVDQLTPDDLPDVDGPVTIELTRMSLQAQAYAEAVNRGLITDPEAFNPEYLQHAGSDELYSWYTTNKDGTTTFNLDNPPTSEQSDQIHKWASNVKRGQHDPDEIIGSVSDSIGSGIDDGKVLVQNEDGVGGVEGAIKIKKN